MQFLKRYVKKLPILSLLCLMSCKGEMQITESSNNASSTTSASAFVNSGNTFGANSTLGTTDNFSLSFLTNNSSRVTILSSGNVGIGSTTPDAKLTVAGPVVSTPTNIASGATVDLSTSNTHTLASVGGTAITLQNMVHGGSYTLVIQDTTSRTYTFTGCNTSKFKPANTATTASTWSIYTILTIYNGTNYDCLITWASGYQ